MFVCISFQFLLFYFIQKFGHFFLFFFQKKEKEKKEIKKFFPF